MSAKASNGISSYISEYLIDEADVLEGKDKLMNDKEYVEGLINTPLVKDLQKNESICSLCYGTSIVKSEQSFREKHDTEWKKHEYFHNCPNCYFGVVNLCEYCGKQLPKGRNQCTCDGFTKYLRKQKVEKEAEILEKAEEKPGYEFDVFYSEHYYLNDGFFSEWEDFFNAWNSYLIGIGENSIEYINNRPKYVWGTYAEYMELDADSIVENACSDFPESTGDSISPAERDDLQALLNQWVKKVNPSPTYYQDIKHKVLIPWEEYRY